MKSDVFSFGVLALVVISGRKNIILEHQGDTVGNLVRDVSDPTSEMLNICLVSSSPYLFQNRAYICEFGFTL